MFGVVQEGVVRTGVVKRFIEGDANPVVVAGVAVHGVGL